MSQVIALPSPLVNSHQRVQILAGIGVRISIYFQAIFMILSASIRAFAAAKDDASLEEFYRATFDNSLPIVFSGLAIVISGLVQALTFGLSAYHTVLLLDLAWVIIISALLPFFILVAQRATASESQKQVIFRVHSVADLPRDPATRLLALHSLHMTITGCFGLWFFSTIRTFDPAPENCTSSTIGVIVGYRHLVTSRVFRGLSLAVHALAAVPLANAWQTMGGLPGVTLMIFAPLIASGLIDRTLVVWSAFLMVIPCLGIVMAIIISIEQTIRANIVAPGEGQWTLGQTLAVLAALISTIEFDKWAWKMYFSKARSSTGELLALVSHRRRSHSSKSKVRQTKNCQRMELEVQN